MSVEYERRPHYASFVARATRADRGAGRPAPTRDPDRDDIDLRPYRARQRLPPPPAVQRGPGERARRRSRRPGVF